MAKLNMQKNKVPMTEADPTVRNQNFEEVAKGYTEEEAKTEAARCLHCKNRPCMDGCPVSVRIPEFLAAAAEGDFLGAYQIILSTNALPAVCGRVCPQENQCEGKCVRGLKGESVGIGRLERFCADYYMKAHPQEDSSADVDKKVSPNGKKVAVIGSGPAGLTCAGDLVQLGYQVTIFEAMHTAGGVLVYGIPEFRLPKAIVKREIEELKRRGVDIVLNTVIGRVLSIDELLASGYEAVFIGSGAGLPSFLGIPGENANGVYSANEFLTRTNLMKAYRSEYDTPIQKSRNVAVVGGGNVAMDAARCAKRLGAENVYILYRRSEEEMPARREEIHHAKEEGILFRMLTNPVRINADEKGNVVSVTCNEMVLGEPDASGRRRPVPKENSEFEIALDTVIMAIGTRPNPLLHMTTPGLDTNTRGCIIVKEDGVSTSREHVYAGGDAVTGAATVILAMGAGKDAARAIHRQLSDLREQ